MREKRSNVDRLFVLGAGASYGASRTKAGVGEYTAPLDCDFTARLSDLDYERPGWVRATLQSALQQWKDHRGFRQCGLEEAILLQLGHLDFLRAIHPKRARNDPSLGEWLSDVAHLIAFTLNRCHQNRSRLYNQLCRIVFPNDDFEATTSRIITFNYDTLLDSVILQYFTPQQTYFHKIDGESLAGRTNGKVVAPLMLKLHGSINWLCSTADF